MVKSDCDGRTYADVDASLASAHISARYVPLLIVGNSHQFSISTSLSIINKFGFNFGDSDDFFNVSSSTTATTIRHTYSYSGQFWLSIYACVEAVDVCETESIPVGVQVPLEFLITYITAVSKIDVAQELAGVHYTLPMGYNVDSYWWRTFNGTVYEGMYHVYVIYICKKYIV